MDKGQFYDAEAALGKVVLDGKEAIVGSRQAVDQYLLKFDADDGRGMSSSGSQGKGKGEAQSGSAPPTASIAKLKLISVLKPIPVEVMDIEEQTDYKDIRKRLVSGMQLIRGLVITAKQRVDACDSRKKLVNTMMKQSKAKANADKPASQIAL